MAMSHWWIRLSFGCVFLEPLKCGLSTIFLNVTSFGSCFVTVADDLGLGKWKKNVLCLFCL